MRGEGHAPGAAFVLLSVCVIAAVFAASPQQVPSEQCRDGLHDTDVAVIWNTDLLVDLSYGDLDDHLDVAVIYMLAPSRVAAIALDAGWLRRHPAVSRPPTIELGIVSLRRLEKITGRHLPVVPPVTVPYVANGPRPAATNALAGIVERCAPVTIVATGSLREIAFLLDHRPDLFDEDISSLWIHAGDASPHAPAEWNAAADPAATGRAFEAPVPIVWVPAFDGGAWNNHGAASWARPALGEMFCDTRVGAYLEATLERDWGGDVRPGPLPPDVAAATPNTWATSTLAVMDDRGHPRSLGGRIAWRPTLARVSEDGRVVAGGPHGRLVVRIEVEAGRWDVLVAQLVRHLLACPTHANGGSPGP